MKSVLISIQPKWCELIASGKKTVEVRKTRPKIEVPFKVYIYCTEKDYDKIFYVDKLMHKVFLNGRGKQKVIGEFVCDRIQKYECEFVDDDCYEEIASVTLDEDDGTEYGFIEWSNDSGVPFKNIDLHQESCIQYDELKKYMGIGFGTFYGWHISELKIYDEPKELGEFRTYNVRTCLENGYPMPTHEIKRPPQSWCYVEGGEQ